MVLTLFLPPLTLVIDLFKYAEIRLKQELDVVDAVLEHGNTIDSDTESQTAVFVAVDSAAFQNLLVNNACTEDFDPARTLAELASLAAALEAGNVYLNGRLREREV
jgi:hypothetical protein